MTGNFFAQFKPCELNTEQMLLPKPLLSGIPVHPRELISLRRAGPHRIPYIGGGLVIQFLAYERIPLLFLKNADQDLTCNKDPSAPQSSQGRSRSRKDKCLAEGRDG